MAPRDPLFRALSVLGVCRLTMIASERECPVFGSYPRPTEMVPRLNPSRPLWHHVPMPKIHIPTPLRQYAGKQAAVEVQGSSIADALSALVNQHPDLRRHLYTDDGKLRAFVNVYLNDEDVRYLQKDATPVKDSDTISIVPSIAGGR